MQLIPDKISSIKPNHGSINKRSQNSPFWRNLLLISLPLMSLSLTFVTLAYICYSSSQFEIFLCLSYAAIHVTVNFLVVVGFETQNRCFLLPWLAWILLSIALSLTLSTVMIFNTINETTGSKAESDLGLPANITISAILLSMSAFYGYTWLKLFELYKELDQMKVEKNPEDPASTSVLTSSKSQVQFPRIPSRSQLILPHVANAENLKSPQCQVFTINETRKKRPSDPPPPYREVIRRQSSNGKRFSLVSYENPQPIRPLRKK